MGESFNVSTRRINAHNMHPLASEITALRHGVYEFATRNIIPNVHNKRVLEIGPATSPQGNVQKYFINLREILSAQGNQYTSIDIRKGPGVDIVADIVNLFDHVEKHSFDVIIGLEILEHVRYLWKIPGVFYDALDHKGIFYTSSPFYFVHHDPKPDYWRISTDGYRALFGDWFNLDIIKVIVENSGDRPINIQVIGRKK